MSSPLFRILCPGCSTELQVVQHQQQGFAFAILEQMNQAGIECKNDPCPVYIEGGGEENADETKNVDEEEKKEQEKTQAPKIPPFHISLVDPVLLAQMPNHAPMTAPMANNNCSNSDDDDVFYDGNKNTSTQQAAAATRLSVFLQGPTHPTSYTTLHAALQAAARGDKGPLNALQAEQTQQAQRALHAQQALQAQRAVQAQRAAALSQPQTVGHPQAGFFVATGPYTAARHPALRAQQQQARILQSIQAARTLQGGHQLQTPTQFAVRNLAAAASKVTKPKQMRAAYFEWEEQMILGLRKAGHSFTDISQRLPRHSTRSIETKWHTLTKGRHRKGNLLSQNQQQQEGRVSVAPQSEQEKK